MSVSLHVFIDRGGTFTDCLGIDAVGGQSYVVKLLSVDPGNYPDAPREGIRRILQQATRTQIPREALLPTANLGLIRMATTVGTNALLERNGSRCAFVVTKGFRDLLHIGNQSRPKIFDLAVKMPESLHESVVEVDERVTLLGYTAGASSKIPEVSNIPDLCVKGVTGEWVRILLAPDLIRLESDLRAFKAKGITSLAVALLHSYTFPDHEILVGNLAESLGFTVSLSHKLAPMIKIVPRANSSVVDAYLSPSIHLYLAQFFSGFDSNIANVPIQFMQSDGGLVPVSEFSGFKSLLSGPAAGVVGFAKTSYRNGVPVLGFDMGGTSTDVSRFDGRFEHVFESITAGTVITAPQLDINTVAAGGGSRLFFRNGMFVVGPESAGANPGPACYRKGGPLTITDANLLLGRLIPDYFPKIFGPSENQPLDVEITKKKFEALTQDINAFLRGQGKPELCVDEVAAGFVQVANEAMSRPIRNLAHQKGHTTESHILSSFGGAGSQHCCALARNLDISRIVIHKYSSILSAYGLALADVVTEVSMPCAYEWDLMYKDNRILETVNRLSLQVNEKLEALGFRDDGIVTEIYLNMRYTGTDCALMTIGPNFNTNFLEAYKSEFGFTLDRGIIVDDIRVRGIGKSVGIGGTVEEELAVNKRPTKAQPKLVNQIWFAGGRTSTPIYSLEELSTGDAILGPSIIVGNNETIVVAPGCEAVMHPESVVIDVLEQVHRRVGLEKDPILLSIFGHRFMSIAEQMGKTLQKTSVSTNIKERLDFSCALFGPDGGLVANAPHIPVHLGSMQEAVKFQKEVSKQPGMALQEGDVIVSNHPSAGGSHLPDITVITPVFQDGTIVFFVASRGHHADIGGCQPGSMPPQSKELYQEGAAIKTFKLVRQGTFDEQGITKILLIDPAQYEGCTGTRCLRDNISDLKAQVAANNRGIVLVKGLIREYELTVVQAYMMYIREAAELSVRSLLVDSAKKYGTRLEAVDFMDDGSKIHLTIIIDPKDGSAIFDFGGTGPEVYGNTNAPKSVTNSAIIYCLRCLVGSDMPLNQGALNPVSIVIPPHTLLSPSDTAAVVGGNVMTSQRLCDVILKAFRACAASQGDCNNFTFGMDGLDGEEGFGYYETIAGGAGAGPSWHGRSGVHTHMTNTRITDPEILERRYPVILRQFSLRPGSGGQGLYCGGDGVIREMEFLKKMHVSLLSERRVFRPYGLEGGQDGRSGANFLIRAIGGLVLNFGGKNVAVVNPGDRIRIETPGGGGYGSATFTG